MKVITPLGAPLSGFGVGSSIVIAKTPGAGRRVFATLTVINVHRLQTYFLAHFRIRQKPGRGTYKARFLRIRRCQQVRRRQ